MLDYLLRELNNQDHEKVKAKDFEDLIYSILIKRGRVKRQVTVPNRGDGRRGKVDLVWYFENETIGIEIDRKTTRKKSIHKLKELGADKIYAITRSPFSIKEIWN